MSGKGNVIRDLIENVIRDVVEDLELLYDKKIIGDVIRKKNGKIVVDWGKIAKMEREAREGTTSEKLVNITYNYLTIKGVLSSESRGNYQLNDEYGVCVNPVYRGSQHLYFTRMEDAEAYKKVWFEGAFYRVNIIHLSPEGKINIKICPEKESEKSTDSS